MKFLHKNNFFTMSHLRLLKYWPSNFACVVKKLIFEGQYHYRSWTYHILDMIFFNCMKSTVQAVRNITNFSCKKFTRIFTRICMNLREFVQILYLNLCTKFVKNSSTNSCLKIAFLRKRHGEKYQYHQYYLRSSRVEFYLHGQTLRYVDVIKGNILFEII